MGIFYAVTGDPNSVTDPTFQDGRNLGRAISTTQAMVEVTIGAVMIEAAVSSIGPTLGGGAACAIATSGTCAVPAGIIVTGEVALGAGGILLAGHGSLMLIKAGTNSVEPGPYAGRSIPARVPGRKWLKDEIEAIDEIGHETGCHTYGTKDPGTKSGHFIPDHQPPSKLNFNNKTQRLYPHCINCSRSQGGIVSNILRAFRLAK